MKTKRYKSLHEIRLEILDQLWDVSELEFLCVTRLS